MRLPGTWRSPSRPGFGGGPDRGHNLQFGADRTSPHRVDWCVVGDNERVGASRRASTWVPAVIVGVILAIAFVAPIRSELRAPVIPQDEGFLLVYPWLMLHGAIPNHTFESVYGASNLWIIAAAFKLLDSSVTVERSVGIAYRVVILASLVVLAWRRRGPVAALAAGAMCIVLVEDRAGLQAFGWLAAGLCCRPSSCWISVWRTA